MNDELEFKVGEDESPAVKLDKRVYRVREEMRVRAESAVI